MRRIYLPLRSSASRSFLIFQPLTLAIIQWGVAGIITLRELVMTIVRHIAESRGINFAATAAGKTQNVCAVICHRHNTYQNGTSSRRSVGKLVYADRTDSRGGTYGSFGNPLAMRRASQQLFAIQLVNAASQSFQTGSRPF